MWSWLHVSLGELHTQTNTKAPWPSQRPEVNALVLLHCCCCTAAVAAAVFVVCNVAASLFLEPRGSVDLHRAAPSPCAASNQLHLSWDYSFVPIMVFPRSTANMTAQNTHTEMHRPWPSQKEAPDVRLLVYRGCHQVESLRDGVIPTRYSSSRGKNNYYKALRSAGGIHHPLRLLGLLVLLRKEK